MKKQYLTLSQSICVAKVFLNILGLILDNNNNDINQFSEIDIFDKDRNPVGKLSFDNNSVMIHAKYKDIRLEASYEIPQLMSFVDTESEDALFGQWSHDISFQIHKSDNTNVSGDFLIECSIDSDYGLSCLWHPLIKYNIPNFGTINLKIQRDGQIFGLVVESDDYQEEIVISPWDSINGYIRHDIKKGQYNNKTYSYPYRRYSGIFIGAQTGENQDKLHVLLKEENNQQILTFRNEMVPKIIDDYSSDALIQKGLLMKKIDSRMYQTIKKLRNVLLIGDTFLLDNLFSICYDSYSDEELESLLGVRRKKACYQDGANSLYESYYGIGKNSHFLSIEQQKKLLKK